MIRSSAFPTQGRLHTRDVDQFLMPTLLAVPNLFLWVGLENSSPAESRQILEGAFHFPPLSVEDCIVGSQTPKVEVYDPKEDDKFSPYLFMVIQPTLFTVVATSLMIVGTWCGMNFKHMPELDWEHGYLYALGLMFVSTAITVLYFKRKGWL